MGSYGGTMVFATVVASSIVLVTVTAAVYSSLLIVEEGELKAVLVFGEMEAVVEPGLNFVPPFISKTYPIAPRTMTIDKGSDRVAVPSEFEDDVRAAANR